MTRPTTRTISRLGVGTYRMALGVAAHERSLYKALERQTDPRLNINLIDTAVNYCNGKSEALVGKVLSHPKPNTLRRDEVLVATKFGYIQNDNMRLLNEGVYANIPPEEIVKYSPDCYHCIHPDFMRDQLTRSLRRLNTHFCDILFVHNPEYYLLHEIQSHKSNIRHHQDVLQTRLAILFEALEKEIEIGRIKSYGISSNSFALSSSHPHFLPYQDLVKMAVKAYDKVRGPPSVTLSSPKIGGVGISGAGGVSAKSAGSSGSSSANKKPDIGFHSHGLDPAADASGAKKPSILNVVTGSTKGQGGSATEAAVHKRVPHGLGFLQMPGNLLELEGIQTTAVWAKKQGLKVFVNRPLNAMASAASLASSSTSSASSTSTNPGSSGSTSSNSASSPEAKEIMHPQACRLATYASPSNPTYDEAKNHILDKIENFRQTVFRDRFNSKMERLEEMIVELDRELQKRPMSIVQVESDARTWLLQELARPEPKVKSANFSSLSSSSDPESVVQELKDHHRQNHHKHLGHERHKGKIPVSQQQTPEGSASTSASQLISASSPTSSPPSSSSSSTAHDCMEDLLHSLEKFSSIYDQEIRARESVRVEQFLTDRGVDLEGEPIQQFAVEYLLDHPESVDSVLLGMKRESYVDFARGILKNTLPTSTTTEQ